MPRQARDNDFLSHIIHAEYTEYSTATAATSRTFPQRRLVRRFASRGNALTCRRPGLPDRRPGRRDAAGVLGLYLGSGPGPGHELPRRLGTPALDPPAAWLASGGHAPGTSRRGLPAAVLLAGMVAARSARTMSRRHAEWSTWGLLVDATATALMPDVSVPRADADAGSCIRCLYDILSRLVHFVWSCAASQSSPKQLPGNWQLRLPGQPQRNRWYMQVNYIGPNNNRGYGYIWVQRLNFGSLHLCDLNSDFDLFPIGRSTCPLRAY